PRNPRDPGLVAVRIVGWSIGSLPSGTAPMLNEALVRDGYAAAICAARIGEARDDAEDDKSKYVFRLSACLPFVLHDVSEVAVPLKTLGQVISASANPEEPMLRRKRLRPYSILTSSGTVKWFKSTKGYGSR